MIQLQSVSLHLGHEQLFDNIELTIQKGEHLGLLGRNGEGKSTLLKVLNQTIDIDSGKLTFQRDINIQTLSQAVPTYLNGSVIQCIAEGFGQIGKHLVEYHQLLEESSTTESTVERLSLLQQMIDDNDGWQLYSKMETVISKLQLPAKQDIASLSGGMKRRVVLGQALLTNPDLLLLDEPTNHLDLESILWLERFLKSYSGAFVLVTHDRSFLQATTNAIIELDRGKLTRFNGDYAYYQKEKASQLASEEKSNSEFDKKLAQEEKWIRQGIKARRTRNEGRVRALKALRKERQQRRQVRGNMALNQAQLDLSSKCVFEVKNLCYAINDKQIIHDFSCLITRQDKIGIVGPNGCGKTTLLQLILGKLTPSSGEIKSGQQFKVAYFDQMKDQIDEEKSAVDNVGQGSQSIEAFGKSQHIISYLKEFLFSPDRARSPVKYLSGGERSRLLLARLFTRNANVLVLDEPSNDLDIESLEILESFLVDYPGTLLMVSHDRTFLENVVTSSWVYQGKAKFEEYIGAQTNYQTIESPPQTAKVKTKEVNQKSTKNYAPKKLSYSEQQELKKLPKKIDALENKLNTVQQALADPTLYQTPDSAPKIDELNQQRQQLETELEQTYAYWEKLENS